MKYIRTKDGIEPLYIDEFTEEGKEYYKNSKIADTIEELCDYWDFYFVNDNEYLVRLIKDYTIKQIKNMLSEGYIKDVNLAIRTDKGLIYVAKMNDKGELELL